jgi:hypothetical protein
MTCADIFVTRLAQRQPNEQVPAQCEQRPLAHRFGSALCPLGSSAYHKSSSGDARNPSERALGREWTFKGRFGEDPLTLASRIKRNG